MKTKSLLIKTAITAVVKGSSAFIAFFMTLAITRNLSPEQSGLFLLVIAVLSASVIFFRLGLDSVVLRKISALHNEQAFRSMTTGLIWVLLACFPFVLVCFLLSDFISNEVFSKPEFANVLAVSIWALPLIASCMLLAVGFQAFHRVIATSVFQNLGLSSFFLLGFYLLWHLSPEDLSAVSAAKIYLLSALLIFVTAVYMWHRQIDGKWGNPQFRNVELWHSSSNMWAATSMSLSVQWSGILMAGVFVVASDIAYLSAAQRTANLTSFVLMVVNMVVAPRYAKLWHEGKLEEIKRLSKWSTRGMVVLVFPVVTVMFVFPQSIMGLFGEGYEKGAILLSIMAVGQLINVVTGSVGFLLSMSGHERDFRRVTFFAGPLTIILSYVLIQQYGVLGAAVATAIGVSVQNIGALFMVKKRLGFWPLG
jgi:O-antigen/teichoic acid export membrane protein